MAYAFFFFALIFRRFNLMYVFVVPSFNFCFLWMKIGTMPFQPAVLAGGYVTDLLLTISFDGEVWSQARIGTSPHLYEFLCLRS